MNESGHRFNYCPIDALQKIPAGQETSWIHDFASKGTCLGRCLPVAFLVSLHDTWLTEIRLPGLLVNEGDDQGLQGGTFGGWHALHVADAWLTHGMF